MKKICLILALMLFITTSTFAQDYTVEKIGYENYKITDSEGMSVEYTGKAMYALIIKQNGKYGLIDDEGYIIAKPEYDVPIENINGVKKVKKNGKYGVISYKKFDDWLLRKKTDKMIYKVYKTPIIYDNITVLRPDFAITQLNGKYGIIFIIDPVSPYRTTEDSPSLLKITDTIYDEVKLSNDEHALIVSQDGRCGMFDRKGNVISATKDAPVEKQDGKNEIINNKGNIISDTKYDAPIENIGGSFYKVKKNGKYGVISYMQFSDGKYHHPMDEITYDVDKTPIIYDSIVPSEIDGYHTCITQLNGKYGFIYNPSPNYASIKITDNIYDEIIQFDAPRVLIPHFNLIVFPILFPIFDLDIDHFYKVRIGDKFGLLDGYHNKIVPVKEKDIAIKFGIVWVKRMNIFWMPYKKLEHNRCNNTPMSICLW